VIGGRNGAQIGLKTQIGTLYERQHLREKKLGTRSCPILWLESVVPKGGEDEKGARKVVGLKRGVEKPTLKD